MGIETALLATALVGSAGASVYGQRQASKEQEKAQREAARIQEEAIAAQEAQAEAARVQAEEFAAQQSAAEADRLQAIKVSNTPTQSETISNVKATNRTKRRASSGYSSTILSDSSGNNTLLG